MSSGYHRRISLFVLITGWLYLIPIAKAQISTGHFRQQISFTSSTSDALPFWLTANQFGVMPTHNTNGALRLDYTRHLDPDNGFTFDVGADFIARFGRGNHTTFFQQLYGEVTWGPFLLRAGRKEETAGNVHPSLSSGSMILSQNAAPITGISISWPEYVTVPGTKTFLAIKGHLKHGWIDGYRITTDPWLHAKAFYMRLGGDTWKVHGYAGLIHYAVWGGTHRNPIYGKLPSTFRDYFRVFFFRGADMNSPVEGEFINALGNSLGAYDFALKYEAKPFTLRLHRQFYLEDTVSMRFRNAWDGLWGLGLTFPNKPALVKDLLYELIVSKRQGSRPGEPIGTDNNYNHFVYSSGWTHRGRALGTPFILTRPGQVGVYNNILYAHYFAAAGAFTPATRYRIMLTISKNYGVNSIFRDAGFGFTMEGARYPEGLLQYAAGLDLSHNFSSLPLELFTRLAYDWGELLPDQNFGFTFGVIARDW